MEMDPNPVLKVDNLSVCFRTDAGIVTAAEEVSFEVFPGETLGIVGESGCGKTVTSKAILRLLPEGIGFVKSGSRVEFQGDELTSKSEREMQSIRGDRIAMIFQEPMTALNPVFTVGWQIEEALKYHTRLSRGARRARALEMLKLVDIPNPERRVREYPHQLSGGMRQRVMIAIALCCEPDVLIADEPTTALDVTIQSQILRLIGNLQKELKTAVVLITHDLGVVAQVCDRILVMYAGRIVEQAPAVELFRAPRHPYTRALLRSIPRAGVRRHQGRLPTIEGSVPSIVNLPSGCRFHDRCEYGDERCHAEEPILESDAEGRGVRCHYPLTGSESVPSGGRNAS